MTIRVGLLSDLEGKGLEFLTDLEGNIIARFFDGYLVTNGSQPIDTNQVTLVA